MKLRVWMSGSAIPLAFKTFTTLSIAPAASLRAAATVLAKDSTPRFRVARSGLAVALPRPVTLMPVLAPFAEANPGERLERLSDKELAGSRLGWAAKLSPLSGCVPAVCPAAAMPLAGAGP